MLTKMILSNLCLLFSLVEEDWNNNIDTAVRIENVEKPFGKVHVNTKTEIMLIERQNFDQSQQKRGSLAEESPLTLNRAFLDLSLT